MLAVVLYALSSCSFEPSDTGSADRRAAAVVLVVGRHVADAGVQSDRVPFGPHAGQLGVENGRVADLGQVRPVGLEVAEEAFDVRLVGGLSG